jgi:hypothetical protein
MSNADLLGPVTLSVTQGISAFAVFLPKLTDVRKAATDDPNMAGDVRLGEVAASTLTLGIGMVCSSLTGSPVPTFTALIVSVVLIVIYESALRNDTPMNPKTPLTTGA